MPGVKGVWKLPGGGSRFINVIAIQQMHAGHAKMAGLVAAGCGSSTYLGRIIIIVDDDIDITNPAEVMWAVATRWDPKTATDIIDGVWTGYIDPMLLPERRANGDLTNSRIIIYAVRPWHWKDEFPEGQCGRSRLCGRSRAQMGRQGEVSRRHRQLEGSGQARGWSAATEVRHHALRIVLLARDPGPR